MKKFFSSCHQIKAKDTHECLCQERERWLMHWNEEFHTCTASCLSKIVGQWKLWDPYKCPIFWQELTIQKVQACRSQGVAPDLDHGTPAAYGSIAQTVQYIQLLCNFLRVNKWSMANNELEEYCFGTKFCYCHCWFNNDPVNCNRLWQMANSWMPRQLTCVNISTGPG